VRVFEKRRGRAGNGCVIALALTELDENYRCLLVVSILLEASLEMMSAPAPTAIAAPAMRADRFSMPANVADVASVAVGEDDVTAVPKVVTGACAFVPALVSRADVDDRISVEFASG
jgi:hypothetical protein